MKLLLSLVYLILPFQQQPEEDSVEVQNIGVWCPKEYPNPCMLRFEVGRSSELLFANDKINFKLIHYTIKGGSLKKLSNNVVSVIPNTDEFVITLMYKNKHRAEYKFKASLRSH